MCGPPPLPFDGVRTIKAWRQPANFPRCDSHTVRGHAIAPWRRIQAYIPLTGTPSAFLGTFGTPETPSTFVGQIILRFREQWLIRAVAGWRKPPPALSPRPGRGSPARFNLQFDLIIERDSGKQQYSSVTIACCD